MIQLYMAMQYNLVGCDDENEGQTATKLVRDFFFYKGWGFCCWCSASGVHNEGIWLIPISYSETSGCLSSVSQFLWYVWFAGSSQSCYISITASFLMDSATFSEIKIEINLKFSFDNIWLYARYQRIAGSDWTPEHVECTFSRRFLE